MVMKLNYKFFLASALLCAGSASANNDYDICDDPSRQVEMGISVTSVAFNQKYRGADGEISYMLFKHSDGKCHLDFIVTTPDGESELVRILNSGLPVNLSTAQGRLLATKVKSVHKNDGKVVAHLRSDLMDASELGTLAAATGETLRLGAQGFALVKFLVDGDRIFDGLTATLPELAVEGKVVQEPAGTLIPAQPAETVKKEEATAPVAQPKVELHGTEFSLKNENGLFKVSGTRIETSGTTNGNMLRVQESILRTKQCKTAAWNMSTGGLYIYSSNGYCTTAGLPKMLVDQLKVLNVPHTNINEVALTESNKWVIVYEKNGFKTSTGLPESLVKQMQECSGNKQHFKTIVMTDELHWVIVTNKGYWTNNDEIKNFLDAAVKSNGGLQAAHVTPEGAMIAVCKRGVACHNVPATVVNSLKTLEFEPKVVKFTIDGRYIITDGKSLVDYML